MKLVSNILSPLTKKRARFLVSGDKIFETNFKSSAPEISKVRIRENRNGGTLNYTIERSSKPDSKLTPKFVVTGHSTEMTAVDALWGAPHKASTAVISVL